MTQLQLRLLCEWFTNLKRPAWAEEEHWCLCALFLEVIIHAAHWLWINFKVEVQQWSRQYYHKIIRQKKAQQIAMICHGRLTATSVEKSIWMCRWSQKLGDYDLMRFTKTYFIFSYFIIFSHCVCYDLSCWLLLVQNYDIMRHDSSDCRCFENSRI